VELSVAVVQCTVKLISSLMQKEKLCAAVVQIYSKAHCFSGAKEELCAAVQRCKRGAQCCCSANVTLCAAGLQIYGFSGAKEKLCAAAVQMCCSVRRQILLIWVFSLCFASYYFGENVTHNAIVVLPVCMMKL
jgi:hypothetical protein